MENRTEQKFTPLFLRLLFYFIIVMLVPLLLLSMYYITSGQRTLIDSLKTRAEEAIARDGKRVMDLIETYRHKAYQISTNPIIIRGIKEVEDSPSFESTAVYETLFSIMKGDAASALALVTSTSGKNRYSTHSFPENYDLRYRQNYQSSFYSLSRTSSETASLITIDNRYITRMNATVVVNILRRIRDEDGALMGYGAVDVFLDAFSGINGEFIFSDIVLIERATYQVGSLIFDKAGSFEQFPELLALEVPYDRTSYQKDGAIVTVFPLPNTSLMVAGIVETSPHTKSFGEFIYITALIGIFGIIGAVILSSFLSNTIAQPVKKLAETMRTVEAGNLDIKIQESKIAEIAQLDRSFNNMVRRISWLLELTREEEAKCREAERKSLESQMQPHFLYNTLNTIKAIAKLHGEKDILDISIRLGKLLRSSIDNRREEWSLGESFSLVEDYLTIQKIRYGEKLRVEMNVDKAVFDIRTPKLIIQPLVENAIIHGLEPKLGLWLLALSAGFFGDGRVFVRIRDNGVGFGEAEIFPDPEDFAVSEHLGLYNVYRRLRLRYGGEAEMKIHSIPGKDSGGGEGTEITLIFPCEPPPRGSES